MKLARIANEMKLGHKLTLAEVEAWPRLSGWFEVEEVFKGDPPTIDNLTVETWRSKRDSWWSVTGEAKSESALHVLHSSPDYGTGRSIALVVWLSNGKWYGSLLKHIYKDEWEHDYSSSPDDWSEKSFKDCLDYILRRVDEKLGKTLLSDVDERNHPFS